MTAKRQPDGTTIYRNQRIKLNPDIRPGGMGRYSWNGRPFTLLAHARAAIDDHFSGY